MISWMLSSRSRIPGSTTSLFKYTCLLPSSPTDQQRSCHGIGKSSRGNSRCEMHVKARYNSPFVFIVFQMVPLEFRKIIAGNYWQMHLRSLLGLGARCGVGTIFGCHASGDIWFLGWNHRVGMCIQWNYN